MSGPFFGWSDTWQLIINTGTTIITFLMVFLIQNTQNRDTEALHLKLDGLIRVTKGARDSLMSLEDETEDRLDATKAEFLDTSKPSQGHTQANNETRDSTEAGQLPDGAQMNSGRR